MKTTMRTAVILMAAGTVSLCVAGCGLHKRDVQEQPAADPPAVNAPQAEHPQGEHPTSAAATNAPEAEHPRGEQPAADHPR